MLCVNLCYSNEFTYIQSIKYNLDLKNVFSLHCSVWKNNSFFLNCSAFEIFKNKEMHVYMFPCSKQNIEWTNENENFNIVHLPNKVTEFKKIYIGL